jgi:hypothetical protein
MQSHEEPEVVTELPQEFEKLRQLKRQVRCRHLGIVLWVGLWVV